MNIQKRTCAIVVPVACVLCLLAAPLAFLGQRAFAQTLELPPPEEDLEQAPTHEKSSSAKSSAAKGKAKTGAGEGEKEKAPEQRGEEEAPAPASKPSEPKAAPSDHKSDHAAESSDHAVKGAPADEPAETQEEHDKPAKSAQAGYANPERSAAKGTGLIWFATAFVVLVVAVFVLT